MSAFILLLWEVSETIPGGWILSPGWLEWMVVAPICSRRRVIVWGSIAHWLNSSNIRGWGLGESLCWRWCQVLCCGGCVGKASRDMAGYEWCVTTCACFWRGCEGVVLVLQCLDPCMSFLPLPLPSVGWPAASILSGGASPEVAHRQVPLWKRPLRQEHPSGRRKKMGFRSLE
jgi:hypothetical protein